MVSTHSRAEAAAVCFEHQKHPFPVSTHSRAEAAAIMPSSMIYACRFQHTAARRRLLLPLNPHAVGKTVSTHSRAEAAAGGVAVYIPLTKSFNTQPPEGGCLFSVCWRFQHHLVSTHSRPKAAAGNKKSPRVNVSLFQHTAARRRLQIRQGKPRKN